jgi:CheY-like chemotaxis protein
MDCQMPEMDGYAGMDAYLTKPGKPQELLDMLDKYLMQKA